MAKYCLWNGDTKLSPSSSDIFCKKHRGQYEDIKRNLTRVNDTINETDGEEYYYSNVWETLIALASPGTNYYYEDVSSLCKTTRLDLDIVKPILYQLRDEGKIRIWSLKKSEEYSPYIEVFDVE